MRPVLHDSIFHLQTLDYDLANRLGQALRAAGRNKVFHCTSQVFLAPLPGARADNID